MEIKEIRYDKNGNYKNHSYKNVEKGQTLYPYINKKPGKIWNPECSELEFIFITDDLNTDPQDVADKYIRERHRLYFYVLDPMKDKVEIEFSRNMESIIDKWLLQRKLKNYKVIHKLRQENSMFSFGSNTHAFDKIYFVTDEINDNLAKATLYDELKLQHVELMNELKFVERMMAVSEGADIKIDPKVDLSGIIQQVDDDEKDDFIEEYVVEKSIFFSTLSDFWIGFKKIFKKVATYDKA